jgi:glycosyltransferase involved in cell wall biosynthesis
MNLFQIFSQSLGIDSNMKIAIITSRYPSESNHYAHTFVHARARYLVDKGVAVVVFVPSKIEQNYTFENVEVRLIYAWKIGKQIADFDCCYLHLLNIYVDPRTNGALVYRELVKTKMKTCFYLHGSEVQKYTTRMFDFKFSIRELARIVFKDLYFIPLMKYFIRKLITNNNIIFFAPSEWMVKEAEQNLALNINDYQIIPNGIDYARFKSNVRSDELLNKAVVVRPLNSRKYAVDICIKTMVFLDGFTLDIYGKGPLKAELVELAQNLGVDNRINFIEEFIPNKKMSSIFHRYGVYLSPTRMDAQGVSMCEAMATGMLVASSNNTAVPEFIVDGENGVLGNSPLEIATKIINVTNDRELYDQICSKGSSMMSEIDNSNTMKKELDKLTAFIS